MIPHQPASRGALINPANAGEHGDQVGSYTTPWDARVSMSTWQLRNNLFTCMAVPSHLCTGTVGPGSEFEDLLALALVPPSWRSIA
jgi:hypothetical protein